MPKEINRWAMYPRKTSTASLPESLKMEVTRKANERIETVLKPKYIQSPPEREAAVQLHRRYLRQVVPQGVLFWRRISRGRPISNRARLRGEICSDTVCREPAFSPLVYALYRPVDTIVHGPDS